MAYFFGKHNGGYILTHHPFKNAVELTEKEVEDLRANSGREGFALMRDMENKPLWVDMRKSYAFFSKIIDSAVESAMDEARNSIERVISNNQEAWKTYQTKLAAVKYQSGYPFFVVFPKKPEELGLKNGD